MGVNAIVFDVDGVLVRAGVFGEILERQYGLDRSRTGAFFQGPFKECILGRADLREALEPFLLEWGWSGSVQDCLDLWFQADSELNQQMLDVAAALREDGRRCYVASTQEACRAAYLEDVLGLASKFDGLFFSCRIGSSKPDRTFFDHTAENIGADPNEILLIDDHELNVEGARAAGWNAELYLFGDDLDAMLAKYGIEVSDA